MELFLLEIITALEDKELSSLFRVCRKSARSAQIDGRIKTEGLSYTSQKIYLEQIKAIPISYSSIRYRQYYNELIPNQYFLDVVHSDQLCL